jgi:condensin complex subunit 3
LSDVEPVVTALAFYLQSAWTQLVVALEAEERDEDQELQQQFIVGELVGIAVNLDYGDEIGRRKMFELMRMPFPVIIRFSRSLMQVHRAGEMLQHSLLPPVLIPMCLDVLLKGTSERDFMRIVVEIVQSLRRESHLVTSDSELGEQDEDDESDKEEEDEAAESETDLSEEDAEVRARRRAKGKGKARRKSAVQTPQQAARRKDLDLRCLFVVKALLERVMSVRATCCKRQPELFLTISPSTGSPREFDAARPGCRTDCARGQDQGL